MFAHLSDARMTVNRCLEKRSSTSISRCFKSSISDAEPGAPCDLKSRIAQARGEAKARARLNGVHAERANGLSAQCFLQHGRTGHSVLRK
jgi:hypothetical protein